MSSQCQSSHHRSQISEKWPSCSCRLHQPRVGGVPWSTV